MAAANDRPGWDEDDARIGVPGAGRTAAPPVPGTGGLTPPARPEHDPHAELREGETELGRPPQVPVGLAALSDADRVKLRQLEEGAAAREVAEAESLIASDPSGLGWLGWFGSPLAFTGLLLMGGLFGLFMVNQVLL